MTLQLLCGWSFRVEASAHARLSTSHASVQVACIMLEL
jgi:hypothetical protein